MRTDAVVVGAGIAGLAAGERLRRGGASVAVLEAEVRPGGRVETRIDPIRGTALEVGAEFVHGSPLGLDRALQEAGCRRVPVPDRHRFREGARWREAEPAWEEVHQRMSTPRQRDEAVASILDGAAAKRLGMAYVKGFHAADPMRASTLALLQQERAAEAIGGDRSFRLREGYGRLVERLARRLDDSLWLNARATELRWRRGRVEVTARNALGALRGPFVAKAAIVTIPLQALKRGGLRFGPEIGARKRAAIRGLAMGPVVKVHLGLREAVLPDGIMHLPGAVFPAWWTLAPIDGRWLVGWCGGPTVSRLPDDAAGILRAARTTAQKLLGRVKLDDVLESYAVHDWRSGAYSWVPVGQLGAQAALAEPVEGTVFFAGEASHAGGMSATVHGAWETGVRAAEEVLRAL